MAMYYQQGSSEIQADGLHTLYLMNPNYLAYSDTQPNTAFMNPTTTAAAIHSLDSTSVLHAPLPQAQQFVGIPLSHDPTRSFSVLGSQQEIQRFHYNNNLWGTVDAGNSNQPNTAQQQRPQCLNLSLSPHQTGFNKQIPTTHHHNQDFVFSPKISSSNVNGLNNHVIMGSKYLKAAQQLLDEVANVGKGITQTGRPGGNKSKLLVKESSSHGLMDGEALINGCESDSKGKSGEAELTTAQRQEIQMKKSKLINMLDEVEQRYREYHHQMEIIVGSFEQAAGIGSAKSYTQLALKTISKQFRCLKDAISSQIKALSKSLGEEILDHPLLIVGEKNKLVEGGSRLKFVDHQVKQQKAMQQLGMIQNNTWRPQRGLPERAVSVLRAWLFEHFLHPYPKDSDKQMLAKQTGLTRSQVSNWFINARVRLWKPMVEEMYQEETKNNQDKTTSIDVQNTSKTTTGPQQDKKSTASKFPSDPKDDQNNKIAQLIQITNQENLIVQNLPSPISSSTVMTTSPICSTHLQPRTSFAHLISSLNTENLYHKNPKKPRNFDPTPQDHNSPSSILSVEMQEMRSTNQGTFPQNYLSSMAAEPNYMGELGRFNPDAATVDSSFHGNMNSSNYYNMMNSNNNVSLTLGLPPAANFEFGTRLETVTPGGSNSVENNNRVNISQQGYHQILDFQNRSKPFSGQVLHDFVA